MGVSALLFLVFFSSNVSAWKNGSYADTATAYDYSTDYGTHDWVADAALSKLTGMNASKWSWLESREKIYLLGTEAPDNSGISITLDGTAVTGFGDTTYHHIYFNEDGTVLEDDAALRAKWCGDQADLAITEQKWDKAAYYLGAMTHYLADQAVYCHTTRNNVAPYNVDFDEYHTSYEGYIDTRTDKYQDTEEFFKINSISSLYSDTPYLLTIQMARDTYFDGNKTESTTRNAYWMYNNHFSSWKTTYETRSADTSAHQLYYNRIEQSLNYAIKIAASAINYVISKGADTSSSGNSDNNSSDDESLDGYQLSFFMLALGITAIFLQKRIKILKN